MFKNDCLVYFSTGITIGDIGPKFGFNGVDNGFLMFDHVRIPLNQMLMGLSKVQYIWERVVLLAYLAVVAGSCLEVAKGLRLLKLCRN